MKSFDPLKISGKYQIITNYYFAATVQVQVNTRPHIHVIERRKLSLLYATLILPFFPFQKPFL